MNKDNAKDFLPLVQALAEGKTIQNISADESKWIDCTEPKFHGLAKDYRIKPEPREFWVCKSTKANSAFGEGTYQAFPYDRNNNNESPAWEYIRVREIID